MKTFEFSENNSGGSWWLDRDDYQKLFDAGWFLAEGWDSSSFGMDPLKPWSHGDDVPYGWRHNLRFVGESHAEAVASWERATGKDVDEVGCRCCGQPYYVSEVYEVKEVANG
jgi:hypothetical protein